MDERSVRVSPDLFKEIQKVAPEGEEAEVVDKILRSYFSGKRDGQRTYKFLDVEVTGRRGAFRGMAVDISRSGMLLRVQDPFFADKEELGELMPYTARVWYHFEGGFDVAFHEGAVVVPADVVRVSGYCDLGNNLMFIGCRFRRALDPEECKLLGVEYADDLPPSE